MTKPRSVFIDVRGGKRIHQIVVDWDGTCVEAKWPEMGDWMPGAIDAIKRFHSAGCKVVIFSARLNPYDPWTSMERDKAEVQTHTLAVRRKLDDAGLHFVDIWTLAGKPGGSVYIDDRAERYNGGAKSWDKLVERVLMRLDIEDPELPHFNIGRAAASSCICYPNMCPMGCEPACPVCNRKDDSAGTSD